MHPRQADLGAAAQQYRREHRDRDCGQKKHHSEPDIGFDLRANHRGQREKRADPVKAEVEVDAREKTGDGKQQNDRQSDGSGRF